MLGKHASQFSNSPSNRGRGGHGIRGIDDDRNILRCFGYRGSEAQSAYGKRRRLQKISPCGAVVHGTYSASWLDATVSLPRILPTSCAIANFNASIPLPVSAEIW